MILAVVTEAGASGYVVIKAESKLLAAANVAN
jgi:hypothetical protein